MDFGTPIRPTEAFWLLQQAADDAESAVLKKFAAQPLPCQDFAQYPWLELIGKTKPQMDRLTPMIRDKAKPMDRAARRRLEKAERKTR